jgi:prepilin-type N-terminal cleavage/methylation domain-containing protein
MMNKRGFTLLETLIALGILSIGVIATVQLLPIALAQVRESTEQSAAAEIADSRVGQLRAVGGRALAYQWKDEYDPARGVVGASDADIRARALQEGIPFADARARHEAAPTEAAPVDPSPWRAPFSSYATTVRPMGGPMKAAQVHRTTVTVTMNNGQRERFVTYVGQP